MFQIQLDGFGSFLYLEQLILHSKGEPTGKDMEVVYLFHKFWMELMESLLDTLIRLLNLEQSWTWLLIEQPAHSCICCLLLCMEMLMSISKIIITLVIYFLLVLFLTSEVIGFSFVHLLQSKVILIRERIKKKILQQLSIIITIYFLMSQFQVQNLEQQSLH